MENKKNYDKEFKQLRDFFGDEIDGFAIMEKEK